MKPIQRVLALAVVALVPAVAQAQKAKSGPEVYATCSTCHQPTGQGLPGAFPPLAGSEILLGRVEVPIAIVLNGLQGEVTVKGQKYNAMMPGWGATFNDQEVANVLTHERSQWGNKAPAVTAADVAKVRAATKARTQPWTIAELKKAYP